jgi:hypothetical protein
VFSFGSKGSFDNLERFLRSAQKLDIFSILNSCGQAGVHALASATPTDSGLASNSWFYEVQRSGDVYRLIWKNSDVESGFPVAIMLQYGYGTGTGGYVQGRDYINPAIRPIFDQIDAQVRKAVTSL